MSQVSDALFRIGDQTARGFRDQGQSYMDIATLGLKKAGMERQAKLDALSMPALLADKSMAEHTNRQIADWNAPFKGSSLMNSLGSMELMVSADKNGTPRIQNAGQYMFGEGTKYDPDKDAFVKKDGSAVTNEEMNRVSPKLQEWMQMNASPYRMARSARDEMVMSLSSLGPDHPDAPAVQQKIKQYDSLMKNPGWKLQSLEKRRVFVQGLPDDPFGEKKNNLAQIDKEIGIVRDEAVAQTKRAQAVADMETKHGYAKGLKQLEVDAADKRAKETRSTTLEAARIRAGASGDKFNKGEAEYQDEWAKNKIVSSLGLQLDMNGNPTGQVTKQQLEAAQILGQQLGYEIQAMPGKAVDRPGWFTGDEPMFQVVGINRINMPGGSTSLTGRQGAGQPGQPTAQPGAAPTGMPPPPDGAFVDPDSAGGTQPVAPVAALKRKGLGASGSWEDPQPYGELSQSEAEMAQQVEQAKEFLINSGYMAADIAAWPVEKLIETAQAVGRSPNPRRGLTTGIR